MSRPSPASASMMALIAFAALSGGALAQSRSFSAADIEAAHYAGTGDLPPGQSALTAKVQGLLDRAGVSPGVIDGFRGGMSQSAISAFERSRGLAVDGQMDSQVWTLLQPYAETPLTQDYTITDGDAQGLAKAIPSDYLEKSNMTSLAHTSIAERLGERFHMHEALIATLNPGVTLAPGATIKVMAPGKDIRARVARIIIDKATSRVAAYDAQGRMIADYPATIGSSDTPSPSGTHTVATTALNPTYTYNPKKNFQQGQNTSVLTIPPGPNGPVGNVWIGLSKPTYGIHGTPTPSRLFVNQSYGCVRLTNWDAYELAHMVQRGGTTVEFLDPGVTIADVTHPVPPAELPELAAAADPANSAVGLDGTTAPVVVGPEPRPQPRPAIIAASGDQPAVMPTPAVMRRPVAAPAAWRQSADQPLADTASPSPEALPPALTPAAIPAPTPVPAAPAFTLPEVVPGQQPGTVVLFPDAARTEAP